MDLTNIPYISVGPRNRTMYVKECFNGAQQSSKTNLDAVIVQQKKSKLEYATDLEEFFVKTHRELD